MAKAIKKRKDKYDPKLAIKGSFEDVIKLSTDFKPTVKVTPPAKKKSAKK